MVYRLQNNVGDSFYCFLTAVYGLLALEVSLYNNTSTSITQVYDRLGELVGTASFCAMWWCIIICVKVGE